MRNRTSLLAAFGAAVLLVLGAATSHAWIPEGEVDYLTFSGPVALPGVTLAAGTYVFERADRNVINLVRVSSRDRKHVYLTAFTHMTQRPEGMGLNARIAFGEARRGTPVPIAAWFPTGERTGHSFIY